VPLSEKVFYWIAKVERKSAWVVSKTHTQTQSATEIHGVTQRNNFFIKTKPLWPLCHSVKKFFYWVAKVERKSAWVMSKNNNKHRAPQRFKELHREIIFL